MLGILKTVDLEMDWVDFTTPEEKNLEYSIGFYVQSDMLDCISQDLLEWQNLQSLSI